MADADLPGQVAALVQLAGRQAGADPGHGHGAIAQGQLGGLGQHGAVQSAENATRNCPCRAAIQQPLPLGGKSGTNLQRVEDKRVISSGLGFGSGLAADAYPRGGAAGHRFADGRLVRRPLSPDRTAATTYQYYQLTSYQLAQRNKKVLRRNAVAMRFFVSPSV